MADELGYATFPGITGIEQASYHYQHGARPGVGSIVAPYDPSFPIPPHYGVFSFYFGSTSVNLLNCALDSGAIEHGGAHPIIRYRVLDRRWKWMFYRVRGAYNQYDDKGQIRADTLKTPQQLATLCLQAMKEDSFDVSRMPNTTRPTVDWEFANAADSLEELCERCSCWLVFDYTTDSVRIEPKGYGADLPDTPDIMAGGKVIDPPELPEKIEYIGSPDQNQWDFELEAVGKERDGTIKPIDDLTYKPAGGWQTLDGNGDWNNIADEELRQLAQRYVFQMYRIKFAANETLDLPDLPAVNDRNHIYLRNRYAIELLDTQIQTTTQDGVEVARPPVVYGIYYSGNDDDQSGRLNNVTETTVKPLNEASADVYHKAAPLSIGWGIDRTTLTVVFGEPVYRLQFNDTTKGKEYFPAKLRLRIAFRAREEKTNAYEHYRYYGNAGGGKDAPDTYKTIQDPNVTYRAYPVYGENNFTVVQIVDNKIDFWKEAATTTAAVIAAMQRPSPSHIVYESIRPVRPDGAIVMVSFEVGGGNPKTNAWRNTEVDATLPSIQQRRSQYFAARQASLIPQANVNANAAAGANPRAVQAVP